MRLSSLGVALVLVGLLPRQSFGADNAHHVAAALGHASFQTTARHYAGASAVANASLRKVAHILTSKGPEPLALEQLANLLESQLTKEQLTSLLRMIQGKLCATG